MKTSILALSLSTLMVMAAGGAPARAQEPAPAQAAEIDLGEIVVLARRPGEDPSHATTECIWGQLPPDQRSALSRDASQAVAALAGQARLPLAEPGIGDDDVADALVACGGVDQPSLLRFVRVALAAYAIEIETARALRADRVSQDRLRAAWNALGRERRETLMIAAMTPEVLTDAESDVLVAAVFELLRRVRPLGAMNPFAYRNGSANHRIVYFGKAAAARTAMERLF